jgi:lysozyme family protein
MKNIETELDVLIGKEGAYSNNPNDSGGETIWGITKAVADAFGYVGAMQGMTKDQAKEIYRKRYWSQPNFDKVFTINPNIAGCLFDTGVNMGTNTPGKFLQRALNVLNGNGTLYPDVGVDGAIGAMTLSALNKFLQLRKQDGENVLLRMLNAQKTLRYMEISENNHTQETFTYGWILNRVGV